MFSKKLHRKCLIRFLVRLCLCKMTSRKLDTPTLMSIITFEKLSNKSTSIRLLPFAVDVLWKGIKYNLSHTRMNVNFNQHIKTKIFPFQSQLTFREKVMHQDRKVTGSPLRKTRSFHFFFSFSNTTLKFSRKGYSLP